MRSVRAGWPARMVVLLVAPVLLPGSEQAQTKPAGGKLDVQKRLIDRPDEIVAVLENGLTVIAKEHRTAPVVSVRMYVKTGSIYEGKHLGAGLSHLFEHLLHGGTTTTRTEAQSKAILEELGGNSNAMTSLWYTTYYINTDRENLAKATNLLADWITNAAFPDSEFKREWGVVQRELERDVGNPQRQLWQMMMETMYDEHPARFPVIGYKPIVQTLTKDEIVAYWRERYVPDNVVVAIVGDVDAEKMLDVARSEFAHFARRSVPEVVLPEQPPLVTPRTVVKRMKMSQSTALMQMCWPSIELTHPDLYALDVLSYVLTEGRSSRMVQSIVREKQLAYVLQSFSWTPHWGRGIFAVMAVSAPDKREACRQAILDEIKKVRADLISADELAKAKRQKAAEHVFDQQTAEAIAGNMASDLISTGDPHFSDAYVVNIQKVTAEQVREMARKYLDPSVLATVAVVPAEVEAEQAATAKADQIGPIKKVTLDNGLRVLLRRDPSVPIVTVQAFFTGGVLAETDKDNGITNLAASLATRGTKTRSAEEIAAFFDSRGGSISGSSGNNTIYFTASVLKEDLAEAMPVFADVVLSPTFPQAELDRLRPRVLNAIDQIDDEWRSELQAFFKRQFFAKSPYRFMSIGRAESVKALTTDALKAYHAAYVRGGNGVLALFGDVDVAEAEKLVRAALAALPAGQAPALNLSTDAPIAEDTLYVRKSKQPAVAGIMMGYRGVKYTDVADRYAMDTLDCIMSGASLPGGWLHRELREGTRDLVYEVHAMDFVGLAPGYYGIYAGCQPERVGEVYRIIREQCEKAIAGKITPEELERAQGIMITTERLQSRTIGQMATRVALDELYGLGYEAGEKYAERVRAVTLDDVKRVAKEFITKAIITVVTPQPEKVQIGIKPTVVE
ncbi:MAG: insulinase family protein [Phycisphaerae bacterium]|nr:insulinase family protein [Phycisphaerae bacterium]